MMWRLGILGDWCVLLIPVVKMKCWNYGTDEVS